MYANDTVLISHSARGLQCLIVKCEQYANVCDITCNVKWSRYMCIKPCKTFIHNVPSGYLNGNCIDLSWSINTYVFLCAAQIEMVQLLLARYTVCTIEVRSLFKIILVTVYFKLKSNYLKHIAVVSTVVIYGATPPLNLA